MPDVTVDDPDCTVPDPDTVASYTFEGALGADSSGNHPGSIRGNVTTSAGRCGSAAARFETGYILVPDDDAFDLATGSIELYARLSTTTTVDNQTLIARDASGTASDGHFLILVGALVTRLQVGGVTHCRAVSAFPVAQWAHVGVSFGGAAGQGLRMWLDGVEATGPMATLDGSPVDCTGQPTQGIAGNDNALLIGASNARNPVDADPEPSPTQHILDGEIDQVHVRAAWRDFSR